MDTDGNDAFRVREAADGDAAFLAALYRGTRPDLLQLGDGAAVEALIALQRRIHADAQRQAYPDARRLLLCDAGRPVAAMLLDRDASRLRVVDLAVLPDARRRGAATALLRRAQAQAAQAGLPLELQVQVFQEAAHRLYLALGFQRCGGDGVFERMSWQAGMNVD